MRISLNLRGKSLFQRFGLVFYKKNQYLCNSYLKTQMRMKKIIGILVSLMLCFTLTSCVTTATAQIDDMYDDVDICMMTLTSALL